MIYTGYYAKTNFYLQQNLTPISISGKCPRGLNILHWKFLAPTWSIFSKWKQGLITEQQYTQLFFTAVLSKINIQELYYKLQQIQNPILLCYEKQGFCHRHLIRDWLNYYNIECEEY